MADNSSSNDAQMQQQIMQHLAALTSNANIQLQPDKDEKAGETTSTENPYSSNHN
jgi:hypothetical protein